MGSGISVVGNGLTEEGAVSSLIANLIELRYKIPKKYTTIESFLVGDDVVTASTEIFLISYRKALKYLSTFKDYEKGLLTANKKGETPLHTIIANCNCVKTIEFLLETDAGKKAAAIKDNDGNTPYTLMKRGEEYFGVYGKEDKETVTKQLLELSTP